MKHVLLDNASLGTIGKEQRAGQFPDWQVSLVNPNFADFARLCGADGERVRAREEIEPAMARMLAAEVPMCCTRSKTPSWCRSPRPDWSSCWP